MNLNRNATLGEVGEFPLIAAITQGLSLAPDVSVGPGDDAAVLMIKDAVATSVDVLVEGVHFRRDWSEARDVGRKAVAVNIADIEAIGARPSKEPMAVTATVMSRARVTSPPSRLTPAVWLS